MLRQTLLFALIPVSLWAQPFVYYRGVANAASYVPSGLPHGQLARGSIFSVFGRGMGPAAGVQVSAFPLQNTLSGVSLEVCQTVADLQAKTLPDPVPANTDLRAVALSPDGEMVCASGLGALSCYDTRTRTFIGRATAAPPNRELRPVFHPNGRWVYLLGRSFVNGVLTVYISEINTATLTETARIPIVTPAADIFRDNLAVLAIDPGGRRLFLDEGFSGVLNIIDTRTHRVVETVEGLTTGGLGGAIVTQ